MGKKSILESGSIRDQLRRVLESSGFSRSRQLQALLSYSVEHAIRNGEASLKERTLGVEVFGRPSDYDPRIDPIVRVQARNLRNRLNAYYGVEGLGDPVLIELAKGSYVPLISFRSASASTIGQLSAAPPLSIAVLPFENLSGDPNQQYLSDGISEELIGVLSRIRALKVVARTSSFLFKTQEKATQEVGRALGVRYVAVGAVRVAPGHIHVNVQLVDAESGYSIWSDGWDRRFEDAFAVQSDAAKAIARELHVELSREEKERVNRPGTVNAASYDAYLRGWHYLHQWSDEGLKLGLEHFKRAVDLDPRNAPAHAGVSVAYAALANNSVMPAREAESAARASADEAVRINPLLGEAQTALGLYHAVFGLQWREAEVAFGEGIRLSPSFAMGHHGLATTVLLNLRRFDEAVDQMLRARELDPLSVHVLGELGFVYAMGDRCEEAVRLLTPAIDVHPDVWFLYEYRALAYKGLERLKDAWSDMEQAHDLHPSPEILALTGFMAARSGRRDRAIELRDRLERLSRERHVGHSFRAIIEAGLGEFDQGFDLLERALLEKEPALRYLSAGFCFDAFWGRPRFDAIRLKLNLPDPLSSPQYRPAKTDVSALDGQTVRQ